MSNFEYVIVKYECQLLSAYIYYSLQCQSSYEKQNDLTS